MRGLLNKGAGYREYNAPDWKCILSEYTTAITNYIKKWANEDKLDPVVYNDWKYSVLSDIEETIEHMQTKLKK